MVHFNEKIGTKIINSKFKLLNVIKRREFNKNLSVLGLAVPFLSGFTLLSNDKIKQKYTVSIGDSKEVMPRAGNFNLKKNPVFVISHNNQKEVIVFDSEMKLQTTQPKKDSDGYQTVEINLKDWQGKAHSKLFDKEVSFRVTNNFKSGVKANYLNQDFPSKMELNFEYEILIDGIVVEKELSGTVISNLDSFIPNARCIFQVTGGDFAVGKSRDTIMNFCAA